MLCYRDRTYCPFWRECRDGETCPRALTCVVRIEADMVRLPICQWIERPECYKEKKK